MTVQNLQVMQVRETEKMILVSGAVPGQTEATSLFVRRLRNRPRNRDIRRETDKNGKERQRILSRKQQKHAREV